MPKFRTVAEALDFAAQGRHGYRFYNIRGEVSATLPYAELRAQALALAPRIAGRFARGSRLAIVAETSPNCMVAIFACQYAGVVPAPIPLPVNLGGKEGYLQQVRLMAQSADADALIGPRGLRAFLAEAAAEAETASGRPAVFDFEDLAALPPHGVARPFDAEEDCYIQFSSGSTSAPKGVVGTPYSVTSNLEGITVHGLQVRRDDHATSWLPLYHDMGLIGFVLSPLFSNISVDFIATSDFVRRPLLWLRVMTENRTTMTYSPSFGYELAARRAARAEDGAIDLSALRVAGIGADMVRPEALAAFAEAFGGHGFDPRAFLPSYGMAEATLAVTFTQIGEPIDVDVVDMRHLNRSHVAQPASALTSEEHRRSFVVCGAPLPGHAVRVRGETGEDLPDRSVGRIFISGPSLTPGYFRNPEATSAMYDGAWMDTGDMGYLLDGQLVITGRAKDLIIINGRNIWPQDIEWAVEALPGVRQNGVAAFSVDDGKSERIVVVVERRGGMTPDDLTDLKRDVARMVQTAAGAPCEIVLARPHSMVMTSSGKLSRAKVKAKYVEGAFAGDTIEDSAPRKALAEARV